MSKARVLIITGDGLNCERESAYAFELAGAAPALVHISDLLDGERRLADFQILAFIGGFANGDHLGAATVQASRFKYRLRGDLDRFIQEGKPIIGICNGFQTLVKMGVLPGLSCEGQAAGEQQVTLMSNDSGKYEDRWVHLLVDPLAPCVWTRGLERLFLPVRHGEGKFFTRDPEMIPALIRNRQVVMQYTDGSYMEGVMDYPLNPNGSLAAIAGVCDPRGTILGLMPHPEGYLSPYNHPAWTREAALGRELPDPGPGVQIFRQGVDYISGRAG